MANPYDKYIIPETAPSGANPYAKYLQEAPKGSTTQGLIDQLNPFGLVGLADESVGVSGAALKYIQQRGANLLGSDVPQEDFNKRYSDSLANSRGSMAQAKEELPYLSGTARAIPAVIGGVAGAGTKAGTAVANSLRTGNLLTRAGKAALTGATSGSLYGFGEGEGGLDSRLGTATDSAITGGVAGGALPIAGAALNKLATPKNIPLDAEDFRTLGGAKYKAATNSGDVFQPDVSLKFGEILEDSKPKAIGGSVYTKEAQRYINSVDEFKDLAGKPLSIDDIDALDKSLGTKISEAYSRGEKFDASKLQDVQNSLRNLVSESEGGAALKEARDYWSKNFKLQDIERIFQRAESAEVPATAIKNGFKTLALNAKKIKAYSPQEIKLIQKAAKTGIGTDILKVLGSRLNAVGGLATGGLDAGATAYATGAASRAGAGYLQGRRGARVVKEITNGMTKPGEANAVNQMAAFIMGGRPTPAQLGKMKPAEAKQIMGYLKQMEKMTPEQQRIFIEGNTK